MTKEEDSGSLIKIRNYPQLCDATIKTADKEYPIHKVVFCTQSEYFARLFNGKWKEATENIVKLEGDPPEVMEAIIDFMYTHKYGEDERTKPAIYHASVYMAADKYFIPSLRVKALNNYKVAVRAARFDDDDFAQIIEDLYNHDGLKQFLSLRQPLVVTSAEYVNLYSNDTLFMNVLHDCPGFAAELAIAVGKRYGTHWERRACRFCNNIYVFMPEDVLGGCPDCTNRSADS